MDIETVPVGNPGNAGELSGAGAGGHGPDRICGSVGYTYNIGKYEVTAGQYTAFLNAVAGVDTYALYDTNMSRTDLGSGITRSGGGTVGNPYVYSVNAAFINRPVNYVNWGDAARFANWLHNNQPTGAQGLAATEDGAYYLNGATTAAQLIAVNREADWKWAITSEDEWYKAAYHKGGATNAGYFDYPTSSDVAPGRDMADASGNNANYYTGSGPYPIDSPYYTTVAGEFQNSVSPYGTFDQGGNVYELNESVNEAYVASRCVRGGAWQVNLTYDIVQASFRDGAYATYGDEDIGFRVVKATDSDNDGVPDLRDNCPNTLPGEQVDANGCSCSPQLDADGDGVSDCNDTCPNTPSCAAVDANGCPIGDSDGDGVLDGCDQCPDSPPGSWVDRIKGCPTARADLDRDGDVDQDDFGMFQRCISGPSVPVDPNCAE